MRKSSIFDIFKCDSQVYAEIVLDCKKAAVQEIIRDLISLVVFLHSDQAYDGWVDRDEW